MAQDGEVPRKNQQDPFVGSKSCARCHAKETKAWKLAPHGRHGIPQATPEKGADAAVGSVWMQAYLKRGEQGYYRIVPVCRDLRNNKWLDVAKVLDEIRGEWPGSQPITPAIVKQRTFERECSGCHTSQSTLRIDTATGRMVSDIRDFSINCESCHGPGREHARAWDELKRGVPMAQLEKLGPRHFNAVCGRCHGGPPAAGDFAVEDARSFVALIDDRQGFFPDGHASGQVYQYSTFARSPCFLKGGLTCAGCHDSHGPGLRHTGHADALCQRCHEDKAGRAHTFHDARREGARCINCHMPRLLKGIISHQREHRISSPLPATPYAPDACTACHQDKDKAWADDAYRQWWGEPPKQTLDAIRGIYYARRKDPRAAPLLRRALRHPDPFFRASAAIYLGDPTQVLEDEVPEVRLAAVRAAFKQDHLRRLLLDREPRVRAAAMLKLVERGEPASPDGRAALELAARQIRDLPMASIVLGVWNLQDKKPAVAERFFQDALVMQPKALDAWLGLATALELQGREEELRQAHGQRALLLRSLLIQRPAEVDLALATASAFEQAGALQKAREVLTRVRPYLRTRAARRRVKQMLDRLEEAVK